MPLRTNPQATLGQVARQRALDHIHNTGKVLSASIKSKKNSIVTVDFQQGGGYQLPSVTIPAYGPEYTRQPYQKGDPGIVLAADLFLGHMSALGPSQAPGLSRPANLSPLVFLPLGNKNWQSVDPDKSTHYGKTGAISRDIDGNVVRQAHWDPEQKTGYNGFAHTKPQDYQSDQIDISKYSHHSYAHDGGITHGTSADHVITAGKNSNLTAALSHNVTTPTTNISQDHNIGGNSNVSKDHTVAGKTTTGKLFAGDTTLGPTTVATLGVDGGMSTGALEVAADAAGGLVHATMGFQVTGGIVAPFGFRDVQYVLGSPGGSLTVNLLTSTPFNFIDTGIGGLASLTLNFPASANNGEILNVSITGVGVLAIAYTGGPVDANKPTAIPWFSEWDATGPAAVGMHGATFRFMWVAAANGGAGAWLLW